MLTSLEIYKLFDEIAKQPIKSMNFPTHFMATVHIKRAMMEKEISVHKVAEALYLGPLIATKVLVAANHNVSAKSAEIVDLEYAVRKLGIEAVKKISLAVAIDQLRKSKEVLSYASLARKIWLRTLCVQSAAYEIAKEPGIVSPQEAQFAGLILKLGGFYLLYRAGSEIKTVMHPDDIQEGLARNYLDLTKKIVEYFSVPKEIRDAMNIDEFYGTELRYPPKSLVEIIYISNVYANHIIEWVLGDSDEIRLTDPYLAMKADILTKMDQIQRGQ